MIPPIGLFAGCLLPGAARSADAGQAAARSSPAEIVVTAPVSVGSVDTPQKPIAILNEGDIQAYGASSIADLLDAIAPETGSGHGGSSPIILVNGVRAASSNELTDYPPEAIKSIEILPAVVSLRYGFPPNQRVVNFILKRRFNGLTLENEVTSPQQGGGSLYDQFKASLLNIENGKRLNIAFETDHTTPLTEAQRGVAQAPGSVPTIASEPNPAAYRDLVANSTNYSINATWTLPIGVGANSGTLAISSGASRNVSRNLSGLNTLTEPGIVDTFLPPLATSTRSDTLQSGISLNKSLDDWQLSTSVDGSHRFTITSIYGPADISATKPAQPELDGANVAVATMTSNSVSSLATMVGSPALLPGGQVSLTLKAGYAWSNQISTDGLARTSDTSLTRGDGSAEIDIGVPLTSRKEGFGTAIGDVTLNAGAGVDRVSGEGWLKNWNGGATWDVTDKLNLQATYIVTQTAPSLGSLGNPTVLVYNVPIYDFTTGTTVLATTIGGGNPNLRREGEHDIKLGLNWALPFLLNSNLIVEYLDNRLSNVAAPFPLLTPEIEAAFPGRVTRGANGAVETINETSVNLAAQHQVRLHWGFNIFGTIKARPQHENSSSNAGSTAVQQAVWDIAIYHTMQLVDRVNIGPGIAPIDLLKGGALAYNGGVARQSIEVSGGTFYHGFGLRLSGKWASPSRVSPLGSSPSSYLRFGALTKFNIRAFIDTEKQLSLLRRWPFLNGMRLSLSVNNILNSRQRVTDGTGATPLSYQPDLVDPLGRVFGIELRKLF